jgi:anti-sigma regulatory factor (Ser/Thr protein kinase)
MQAEIALINDIVEIGRLADRVRAFGREHNLSEELVWEIRLVLEEVVTNIISYGYEDRAEHIIVVCLSNSERDVTLSVEDDARPFNLLEHPVPDLELPLEDRGIGGMGIHLVRRIMDEITYTRAAGRNRIVMRRHKLRQL